MGFKKKLVTACKANGSLLIYPTQRGLKESDIMLLVKNNPIPPMTT